MTHKLFWRRHKEKACGTCQELPSGLPCYDCTFSLQSPPPRYASIDNPPDQPYPDMPVKDGPTIDVAFLAQGVSRIGVAIALAIDPAQDAVRVPSHPTVERIRHRSEQRSSTRGSAYPGFTRSFSAPSLHRLDSLFLPEPTPVSPWEDPPVSSVEEAPLAAEEVNPLSTEADSSTTLEEETEELSLSSDEEPHVLLTALTTITPPPELNLDVEREPSPLPCQLLIPE